MKLVSILSILFSYTSSDDYFIKIKISIFMKCS